MRIGINTLFLIPGEVGGSETYLCETLMALAQHYPDLRMTLFTNLENDSFLRQRFNRFEQIRFVLLRFRAQNRYMRIIREQVELPFRVARAGIDLLWSPGYTAPFAAPVPQVVSILDMQYRRFPEDLGWLARVATDLLIRAAVYRARRLFAISMFSKQEIMALTPARPDRIDVTRLAANPDFAGDPGTTGQAVLAKRGHPSGPYLLCVAHTYPHKNVPALIRAFDELGPGVPHRLVLVGKPRRGEPAVDAAWRECGCRDRVTRIGQVEMPALIALYQGCDALVFPSLYEGFGLPVLEAMLAGVPVITADIPACREIGGDLVITCKATDVQALAGAIRQVLAEPAARRAERIAAARCRAMEFTWAETARRVKAGFEKVLSPGLK